MDDIAVTVRRGTCMVTRATVYYEEWNCYRRGVSTRLQERADVVVKGTEMRSSAENLLYRNLEYGSRSFLLTAL
jgi:hypothetical protein